MCKNNNRIDEVGIVAVLRIPAPTKMFILSKTQQGQWMPVFFVEGKGDAAWS